MLREVLQSYFNQVINTRIDLQDYALAQYHLMELNAKKQLLTTPLKYRPIEKVATRDQIDWYELQYEKCTN